MRDKPKSSKLLKLLGASGLAVTDTAIGLFGAEQILPSYEFSYVLDNYGVELVPLLYFTALAVSYLEIEGVYRLYTKIRNRHCSNTLYAHKIKITKAKD